MYCNHWNRSIISWNELTHFNLLLFIQLDFAWTVDRTRRQWIDMGIVTGACMLSPASCTAGGAISFWLNIPDAATLPGEIRRGILQSYLSSNQQGIGFYFSYSQSTIRYCDTNKYLIWFNFHLAHLQKFE